VNVQPHDLNLLGRLPHADDLDGHFGVDGTGSATVEITDTRIRRNVLLFAGFSTQAVVEIGREVDHELERTRRSVVDGGVWLAALELARAERHARPLHRHHPLPGRSSHPVAVRGQVLGIVVLVEEHRVV